MIKMKELLTKLMELHKKESETQTLSIHIEGEEDNCEVVIYPETTLTFDDDSVLIDSYWEDTDGIQKPDRYLFRVSKIVSVVLA